MFLTEFKSGQFYPDSFTPLFLLIPNPAAPVLEGSYVVLGIKGLSLSPPNILLLIMAKQLNLCFIQKSFSLSMWSAENFHQALRCRVFFLAWQPLSPWQYKTCLTAVIDTCLPADSNSLQAHLLVVFGWPLTIPTTSTSYRDRNVSIENTQKKNSQDWIY